MWVLPCQGHFWKLYPHSSTWLLLMILLIYKLYHCLCEAVSETNLVHAPNSCYNQMECLCFSFPVYKLGKQCPIHLCTLRTHCWTRSNSPQASVEKKVKIIISMGGQLQEHPKEIFENIFSEKLLSLEVGVWRWRYRWNRISHGLIIVEGG